MIRIVTGICFAYAFLGHASTAPKAADPTVPEISGLTAEDRFPGGCVDCHVNMPEANMDVRISTQMNQWYRQVDQKLLATIRAVIPDHIELLGRHPRIPTESFRDIPTSCMTCHGNSASNAPRMGPMMHVIHLIGRQENHFLTLFKGECTHCHKFNRKTGVWSMPSGPEK